MVPEDRCIITLICGCVGSFWWDDGGLHDVGSLDFLIKVNVTVQKGKPHWSVKTSSSVHLKEKERTSQGQRRKDCEDGRFKKAMKEAIYVKIERLDFNQLSLWGSYSAVLSYPAVSAQFTKQFTPSAQRLPQRFTSVMCDEGTSTISSQPRTEWRIWADRYVPELTAQHTENQQI